MSTKCNDRASARHIQGKINEAYNNDDKLKAADSKLDKRLKTSTRPFTNSYKRVRIILTTIRKGRTLPSITIITISGMIVLKLLCGNC